MKQPVKILAMVALMTGSALTMKAQDKSIRLDPVTQNTFKLTYKYASFSRVKVEVIDPSGKVILLDRLNHNKSFTKPYTFDDLPGGVYTFKVTDKDGEYVRLIDRSEHIDMNATIETVDQERAKVVVRGGNAPVHVKVLDRSGVLVYDDIVKSDFGFSRLYDLSKVLGIARKIEVSSGTSILASAYIK